MFQVRFSPSSSQCRSCYRGLCDRALKHHLATVFSRRRSEHTDRSIEFQLSVNFRANTNQERLTNGACANLPKHCQIIIKWNCWKKSNFSMWSYIGRAAKSSMTCTLSSDSFTEPIVFSFSECSNIKSCQRTK